MLASSSLQPGRHAHYCSRTLGDNHDQTLDTMSASAVHFSQTVLLVPQDEEKRRLSVGRVTCFLDVHDDSRTVVRPSTGVGKIHQAVHGLLRRSPCQAGLEV